MSLTIRRLDPANDHELFAESYSWLEQSPAWRKETEQVFGVLARDDYFAASLTGNRVDVGIFSDNVLVAKVALHLVAKHTYEVSLEAVRGADKEVIAQAGCLIRDQLFGAYGARCVFAWVPSWAKGVQHVLLAIGFHDTYVSMLKGTCRNRVIEWLRFSIEVQQ